jgi:SAF domain
MSAGQPGGNFGTVFHPEPDPLPAGNGGPVRAGQLRPLPRRRRPGMIALAVALIGAGILGGATLFQRVNHQVPVLLISTAVPAGTTVTAADLTTASVVLGAGVRAIPARQEHQVVGLVAASDLQPGTLLAASDLTSSLPPAGGQVLVPAALKPSQLPASGLAAGDHVVVVFTPSAQGGSGSAATAGPPPRNVPAVVEAVTRSPDSDSLDVVDLLVPELAGPGLAREAATGDVALIVTSRVP